MEYLYQYPYKLPKTAIKTSDKPLYNSSQSPQYSFLHPSNLGQTSQHYSWYDQPQSWRLPSSIDHPEASAQGNFLSYSYYESLKHYHRLEIYDLLLYISRLHDTIYYLNLSKKNYVQRVKDDIEQMNYLQMSHLKQSQYSQNEMLEIQLRKCKEMLLEKTQYCEYLEIVVKRYKYYFAKENYRLKGEIKLMIEKKNEDVSIKYQTLKEKMNSVVEESQHRINYMKYHCNKQIEQIQNSLAEKEREYQKLKHKYENNYRDNCQALKEVYAEKQAIEYHYKLKIIDEEYRYYQLRNSLQTVIDNSEANYQYTLCSLRTFFEQYYQKLIELIRVKNHQIHQLAVNYQTTIEVHKHDLYIAYNENYELKYCLKSYRIKFMQYLELTKVKVATLHQNDLKSLVYLYDSKIATLTRNLQKSDYYCLKAKSYLHYYVANKLSLKKKYYITISYLNAKIMRLCVGMNTMYTDHKYRLYNYKSLMLMASKSFIKDVETKTANVKFQYYYIRKMRQLLYLQAKEMASSERNVEEKIKLAQDYLDRLSNKIISIKMDSKESEENYKRIVYEKEKEIYRLNREVKDIVIPIFDNSLFQKEIKSLKEQIGKKIEYNSILKDKVAMLYSNIRYMRAHLYQSQLYASINQEYGKKHYKTISDANLSYHRTFYYSRIEILEYDKVYLKKMIKNQQYQITELVGRYRYLELSLKDTIKQLKRRSYLDTKVIELGGDINLTKNMAYLFVAI